MISDKSTISAEHIFSTPEFGKVVDFVDQYRDKDIQTQNKELPQIEYTIEKSEKFFHIGVLFLWIKALRFWSAM